MKAVQEYTLVGMVDKETLQYASRLVSTRYLKTKLYKDHMDIYLEYDNLVEGAKRQTAEKHRKLGKSLGVLRKPAL